MFNQINEAQTQIQSSVFNFQPNILPERQNKIRNIKAQIHDSGATGTKDNSYEGFFHLRNTPKRRQLNDIHEILPNPFTRTEPEPKRMFGKSYF